MRTVRRTWRLAGLAAAALAGCAGRVQPPPAPARPAPAPHTGQVGFRVVADPSTPSPLADRQDFVAPHPAGELAKPVYPAGALEARTEGVVGIRVTIGPDGALREIADSPVVASTPGPHAAAFREAVERAVRAWRFTAPRVDLLEDGNDLDGDGKPDYVRVVQSVPVSVFYDVRFEFAIVDGAPTVLGGPP